MNCPTCGNPNPAYVDDFCQKCHGRMDAPVTHVASLCNPAPAPVAPPTVTAVRITDFDMPFVSMVGFMVKAAIAAVPALLILAFIGYLLSNIMTGAFGVALSGRH